MRDLVRRAFLAARQGYSPDRVVADPDLNRHFLAECRALGSQEPDVTLNQCLLNLRKGRDLKGLPRSRPTSFADEEEYRFASEIAARHVERAKGTTVDRILCDPQLVSELDQIASQLAPGYTALQYRWAALNLRKAGRLKPELLARVAPKAETVSLGPVAGLDAGQISGRQGLYLFYDPESKQTLYVGEAKNLRKRLDKHLDHSDIKSLAHWLWQHGSHKLYLELHLLPDGTATPVRRALEAELIRTRHPLFNVQRP
jgi:site-specific DNA-methyltransferase (adenine-specific)